MKECQKHKNGERQAKKEKFAFEQRHIARVNCTSEKTQLATLFREYKTGWVIGTMTLKIRS